jgi:hypothetical protein
MLLLSAQMSACHGLVRHIRRHIARAEHQQNLANLDGFTQFRCHSFKAILAAFQRVLQLLALLQLYGEQVKVKDYSL